MAGIMYIEVHTHTHAHTMYRCVLISCTYMHDRGCVESTLLLITQCTRAKKSKEVNKNIQNEVFFLPEEAQRALRLLINYNK